MARMVDDWWSARERGESVMQAPSWRDVTELNARARAKLSAAGLVDPEGLDVRGTTIGRGDQVIVLRNAPALGVINGTVATVTAIDPEANHLYYTGEPPPHEDHHHAEVAQQRSRAW